MSNNFKINTNLDKLGKMEEFVDTFKNDINKASKELEVAAKRFKERNSNEDIGDVLNTVKEITDAMTGYEQNFKDVKDMITAYIKRVNKVLTKLHSKSST